MAEQIVTLGIGGTPANLIPFITSGLEIGAALVIIPVCVTLSSAITDPKILFNIIANPVGLSNTDNPVSLSDEECV